MTWSPTGFIPMPIDSINESLSGSLNLSGITSQKNSLTVSVNQYESMRITFSAWLHFGFTLVALGCTFISH